MATSLAYGSALAAGIGSGSGGSCGDISISGGKIGASGGFWGAGIGSGGEAASCGDISISGGDIKAKGGSYAAGIGSGSSASCGRITIGGTATGTANGGENSPYDIGPGSGGKCSLVSVEENTISGRCYNNMVNLSELTQDYVAQDGDVLTGEIDNSIKISVADGARITLSGVSINAGGAKSDATKWAGITCLGDATITLEGQNIVNACSDNYPGIQAGPENTTLTIKGTGSLTAQGHECGAGIGSGFYTGCGDISISGGTIKATGGDNAAGIGSGYYGSCGKITIDGTASGTAKGGEGSQWDIGYGVDGTCGYAIVQPNTISGRCYNNTVNLSTLTGHYVAQDGDILTGTIDNSIRISIAAGARIMLSDAYINASGAESTATDWAGITCQGDATITLVGKNVVNSCSAGYPGIQAGPVNTTLTIDGTGSLDATGGSAAAGIGGGGAGGLYGDITISGGTITATGGYGAAGIGSGNVGSCGKITIRRDASGKAKGGPGSAYDIGPGDSAASYAGKVTVESNSFTGSYPGQ